MTTKADGSPHRCNAPYVMSPTEFSAQPHIKERLRLMALRKRGGRTVHDVARKLAERISA